MTTTTPEPRAIASPGDLYIQALRASRDQLEMAVAGLTYRANSAEAEVAELRAQIEAAAAEPAAEPVAPEEAD